MTSKKKPADWKGYLVVALWNILWIFGPIMLMMYLLQSH
jgi:hypothetical protein